MSTRRYAQCASHKRGMTRIRTDERIGARCGCDEIDPHVLPLIAHLRGGNHGTRGIFHQVFNELRELSPIHFRKFNFCGVLACGLNRGVGPRERFSTLATICWPSKGGSADPGASDGGAAADARANCLSPALRTVGFVSPSIPRGPSIDHVPGQADQCRVEGVTVPTAQRAKRVRHSFSNASQQPVSRFRASDPRPSWRSLLGPS